MSLEFGEFRGDPTMIFGDFAHTASPDSQLPMSPFPNVTGFDLQEDARGSDRAEELCDNARVLGAGNGAGGLPAENWGDLGDCRT